MTQKDTVLVLGAAGQIGTDLVQRLRNDLGGDRVIATDVKSSKGELRDSGPFLTVDVLDFNAVAKIIEQYNVKQVYLLAALLSATAEQTEYGRVIQCAGHCQGKTRDENFLAKFNCRFRSDHSA